ncbi:LysR substrate-binding domain-containing protein [Paenibacillus glycanilyticus]|uniref:LysR family transcriptional regulator n=1 Tax=Paenibacillus glycanilyticus TaxID=126569 RepID=UPI00203E39DD|nr:LysR substrate-binding domain-containing protein [Paenibacillus glycanilyticus]MCM3631078.1 LysR substrate-binding domain-containing protein [Paenibacillus glycanilyticus]
MELRQLRYFMKVAETLHFGRAAEQLHMAQQPLSYQIKRLEDEIGVELLKRTTRTVALTAAGEALLADVQAGLGRIDRGVEIAQQIARGEGGKLIIGYSSYSLYSVLPPIVRLFRERFPDFEIVLLELVSPELELKVLNEEVDIGFLMFPGAKMSGLAYETIYQEPAAIALPKNHPLAERQSLSLRELENEKFVMYSRSANRMIFDDFISLCHLAGFSPVINQEAATESAIISLVAAGVGVSLVASSISRVRPDEVAYRRLIDPPLISEAAVLWKEEKKLPILQEIRQIAREVTQREGSD